MGWATELNLMCDSFFLKTTKSIYDDNMQNLASEYGFDDIEDLIDSAIQKAKGDQRKTKRKTKRKPLRDSLRKSFRKSSRKSTKNSGWIFCDNKSSCYRILNECIQCEIQSTYYWLRLLSDLMINGCIQINCKNKTKITGMWENDSKHISIQIGTQKGNDFIENKSSRCENHQ